MCFRCQNPSVIRSSFGRPKIDSDSIFLFQLPNPLEKLTLLNQACSFAEDIEKHLLGQFTCEGILQ